MFASPVQSRVAAIVTALTLPVCGSSSHAVAHANPYLHAPRQGSRLRVEQLVADSTSFDVNAELIVGPTEAILIDAQYHVADAKALAQKIAATGKHLKAIFITHPDHDHYAGAAVIVERFPGTPVYMTAVSLAHFREAAPREFGNEKARRPELLADSVVTPRELPSVKLAIDGESVEIIPDLQGDVLVPSNSIVWIPSLKTVIAGDVVFSGVHVWLGASSEAARAAWQKSLQRITDLHPATVIAGHKRRADLPDTPDVVQKMSAYLTDFDAARKTAASPQELAATMRQKYPDWGVPTLLQFSAMQAMQTK